MTTRGRAGSWILLGVLLCVTCPGLAQAPGSASTVEVKKGTKWYRATVIKKEGEKSLVHFEGASADFDEWVTADRLREAATSFAPPAAPKAGGAPPAASHEDEESQSLEPKEPGTPPIVRAHSAGAEDLTPNPDAAPAWSATADTPAVAKRRPTAQPIQLFTEPQRNGRSFSEQYTDLLFSSPEAARAIVARVGWATGKEKRPGRLECIDLAVGKSVGFAGTAPETRILDFSPDGTRVLMVSDPFGNSGKDRLDVGEVAPKPQHIVSFKPYESSAEDDIWTRNVEWAHFVDNTHVLTSNSKGDLTLWEVPAAKAVYKIKIARTPAMSPTRKYFAATIGRALVVFESATGKCVGRLAGDTPTFSLPFFRPDGKQVAALGGGMVRLWDFETGKAVGDIQLPPKVFSNKLDWVADDYLLIGDTQLIDCRLKAVVWEYEPRPGAPNGVFGGRFWYLADGTKFGSRALASAILPEPAARKAIAGINPNEVMAIKPGVSVTLEINMDASQEARDSVTKSLNNQLKANGIKVADGQPIKLMASTTSGETRQITYHGFGLMGGKTISVTDLKLRLAFEVDGKTLWEINQVISAPAMISLQKDQTIDDAVAKFRADGWKFLESARLPKTVADLPEKTCRGRSKLTAKGVEPSLREEQGAASR